MEQTDKITAEMSTAADNYWDYVPAMLSSALRSNRDVDEYIQRYRALIDFGIAPTQLAEVGNSLPTLPKANASLKLLFVSDWIKHFIAVITKQEERDRLFQKEKRLSAQMKLMTHEITVLQEKRNAALVAIFDVSEYRGRVYHQLIQSLPMVDKIKYDSMIKNEAASRGRYFGVDERRTLAGERQWILQQDRKIEALISMIDDRETRVSIISLFEEMSELQNRQLDLKRQIDFLAERRFALDEEIAAIPVDKITAKISEKVLRMKLLITEEIGRVGGETGVFRRAKEQLIDINLLNSELRRIIEFDREIFGNTFTNKFGLPTVLLVPGKGDGIYDSHDNMFIMPMIPNFNMSDSIASALVSYRLYHDESKAFIRSYGKLAMNANVAMGYTLRMQLIKSYSKWVTMEYEGYHAIEKEEREWFAHHCAPKKGEFYLPFEMVRGALHGEQYDDLIAHINEGFKMGTSSAADIWMASLISCKRGELEKAELHIKKLMAMSSDYIFALFNMGIIALKTNRDDLAIEQFTRFINSKPPKWWGLTAQEYLLALKELDKKA